MLVLEPSFLLKELSWASPSTPLVSIQQDLGADEFSKVYYQPVIFLGPPKIMRNGLVLFFEASKYIKRKKKFFNGKQDNRSYSHSFNTHT